MIVLPLPPRLSLITSTPQPHDTRRADPRLCGDCKIPLRPNEVLRCRRCCAWRVAAHHTRLAREAMEIALS